MKQPIEGNMHSINMMLKLIKVGLRRIFMHASHVKQHHNKIIAEFDQYHTPEEIWKRLIAYVAHLQLGFLSKLLSLRPT